MFVGIFKNEIKGHKQNCVIITDLEHEVLGEMHRFIETNQVNSNAAIR